MFACNSGRILFKKQLNFFSIKAINRTSELQRSEATVAFHTRICAFMIIKNAYFQRLPKKSTGQTKFKIYICGF